MRWLGKKMWIGVVIPTIDYPICWLVRFIFCTFRSLETNIKPGDFWSHQMPGVFVAGKSYDAGRIKLFQCLKIKDTWHICSYISSVFPIPSMYGMFLPTFTMKINQMKVKMQSSHGPFGVKIVYANEKCHAAKCWRSALEEWRQAFLVLSAAERMSALGIGWYM